MPRYQLRYLGMAGEDPTSQSIDVPDIKTALLVADINVASGRAEIWEGDRLIASIARQSNGPLPFWHVE